MPLSLDKLKDFLVSKGFIPNTLFILDNLVFYIELVSISDATKFLLYIPSKYEFVADKSSQSYKIKYIDLEGKESITEEYAGSPEDISTVYGNTNINVSPDKSEKIEDHLEDNYKRPISLSDISPEDTVDIKAIYRQVRRLKYCVQNIKYKAGILFKNYICAIRRDDSIDCFYIKHYDRRDTDQLFVITDLEILYEKSEKLLSDVKVVRDSILNILNNNQGYHTN